MVAETPEQQQLVKLGGGGGGGGLRCFQGLCSALICQSGIARRKPPEVRARGRGRAKGSD